MSDKKGEYKFRGSSSLNPCCNGIYSMRPIRGFIAQEDGRS